MRFIKYVSVFIVYFPFVTFIFALFWTTQIAGKLFVCTDKFPILDFIPPFVHNPQTGDYYIADPNIVWGIWFGLIILDFVITIILSKKLNPFIFRKT